MAHGQMLALYSLTIITSDYYTSIISASTVGLIDELTTTTQEPPVCPEPSKPNNGTVITWGRNLLVEYMCDPGLFPIGPTFGSCDKVRKRWSIRKPRCVSSDCDHPGNVTNGRVYFDYSHAKVTTVCDPGYKVAGSRVRYCNGYRWSGFNSRCLGRFPARRNPMQANDPDESSNGTENSYKEDVLDADDTCSHSYKAPPKIDNGTVTVGYAYNTKRRQWVMVANYTCLEGYTLKELHGNYKYCKRYKWTGDVDPECVPVAPPPPDPCKNNNGGCDQICIDIGSGRTNCDCRPGYGLRVDFRSCRDIDECRFSNGECEHFCHNLRGSYFCTCRTGYVMSGNRCLDEDECWSPSHHVCEHGCINTPGSYKCNCSVPGYRDTEGGKTCADVDECTNDNGGCESLCINTIGSFKCKCNKGYSLSLDNITCEDIDECTDSKQMKCKGGVCNNTEGSFLCECHEGYKLKKSRRRCIDIDECSSASMNECEQECVNLEGSYSCDCVPGYALTNFSTCAPCPVGYYRSARELECTACPLNAITNTTATLDIDDCACLPGYHGNITLGEDCLEREVNSTIVDLVL